MSALEVVGRLRDVVPNGILAASSKCVVVGLREARPAGCGVVVDHTVSAREVEVWLRDVAPQGILTASSRCCGGATSSSHRRLWCGGEPHGVRSGSCGVIVLDRHAPRGLHIFGWQWVGFLRVSSRTVIWTGFFG